MSVPPSLPPPIVGGDTTADFDAVGALVAMDGAGNIAGSFCSGILIDEDVVLTAAHCIDGLLQIQDMGFGDSEFVIGTDVFTTSGVWERLRFTESTQHPQWDPSGYENDVALVPLTRPSEVGMPALLNRGIADGDCGGAAFLTCPGSDAAVGAARVYAYLSWIGTYVVLEEVE